MVLEVCVYEGDGLLDVMGLCCEEFCKLNYRFRKQLVKICIFLILFFIKVEFLFCWKMGKGRSYIYRKVKFLFLQLEVGQIRNSYLQVNDLEMGKEVNIRKQLRDEGSSFW